MVVPIWPPLYIYMILSDTSPWRVCGVEKVALSWWRHGDLKMKCCLGDKHPPPPNASRALILKGVSEVLTCWHYKFVIRALSVATWSIRLLLTPRRLEPLTAGKLKAKQQNPSHLLMTGNVGQYNTVRYILYRLECYLWIMEIQYKNSIQEYILIYYLLILYFKTRLMGDWPMCSLVDLLGISLSVRCLETDFKYLSWGLLLILIRRVQEGPHQMDDNTCRLILSFLGGIMIARHLNTSKS